MNHVLPPNPDIDHLKNQAKALLKAHHDGATSACKTLRRIHRFENASDKDILAAEVTLSDAQFALAMDYGFKDWEDLRRHVLEIKARQNEVEGPRAGAFRLKDPPPGRKGTNRLAYGYYMALQHCGIECDYDTIMGDSGLAFILQADTKHTAWGKPVKQLDIGYWPLDPWGALARVHFVGRTCGMAMQALPFDANAYQADGPADHQRRFQGPIVESLRAGRPAVACVCGTDVYVVTGYDDGQPPLLGQLSCLPEPKVWRLNECPWTAVVLQGPVKAMDRRQADVEALRYAVDLAYDRLGSRAPADKLSGQAAFALWAKLLRDDEGWGANFYHRNVLGFLKTSRGSAVPYLREMAKRHPGPAQSHLLAATQAYADGLAELDKAQTSKEIMGTHEGREQLAQLVERAAKLDLRVAQEIEQALAAMP